MADQVLYSGVACITDLMVKEGLINLDFADVRSIMSEMGKAMMGTGEATGDRRAVLAAEAAIANPLLDETSMKGARGLLISITGGNDLTLYEVDEAASRIRQEVDEEANIILGATFDSALDGVVRVSVVATGIDQATISQMEPVAVQPRSREAPRMRAPRARSAPRPCGCAGRSAPAGAIVNDLEIQPVASGAVAFPEPIEARREHEEETTHFIPPAPEQPAARPAHAADRRSAAGRAESDTRNARSATAPGPPAPETRRRSLLEKLAAFGITRHEEEPASPKPAPRPCRPPRSPARNPRRCPAGIRTASAAAATTRAAAGALDPHGRPIPRPPATEDDHLDIPAFLRRQPN